MNFKKYKGFLSLVLSIVLTLSVVNISLEAKEDDAIYQEARGFNMTTPAGIGLESLVLEEPVEKTAEEKIQEVLDGLRAEFSAYGSKNPIPFPYGLGEGQYINAVDYMEDRLKEMVPEYDVGFIYSSTLAGTVSYSGVLKQETMDQFGNIQPVYNEVPSKPAFMGVKFKIGDFETAKTFLLYFEVDPIAVSNQEMVDKEASALIFDAIKASNTSQEYITSSLGRIRGNTVTPLATTPELYKENIIIKWHLTNIQGNENALSLDSANNTTAIRPNVGEGDAKFKLTASLSHKEDSSAVAQVDIDLTVPEFVGYKVPFRLTPSDAKLEITDSYYQQVIDERYIDVKEGGSLREVTLHGSATDGSQGYAYELSKEGYITQKARVTVSDQDLEEIEISLAPSSFKDTQLESLEITSPAVDSTSILRPMESFASEKMDYEMTVGDIPSITIKPTTIVEGAAITVNAATSKTNNTLKDYSVSSGRTRICYLAEGDNTIKITVTAPDSSTQEIKEESYTLIVTKDSSISYPLKGMKIEAYDSQDMGKNNPARPEEEVLSPGLDTGGIAEEYTYYVNAYREDVEISPIVNKEEKIDFIKVNNVEIDGTSEKIPLNYGNNRIIVEVKEKNTTEPYLYTINIRRKQGALIKGYFADGYQGKLTGWTGQVNFDHSSAQAKAKFDIPDDAYLTIDGIEGQYKRGETIDIPMEGEERRLTTVRVHHDYVENGISYTDSHAYIIGFYRRGSAAPNAVESYLPGPGQFVNQSSYIDPVKTLRANPDMVTLGSFGGSIVYRFDDPIKNDPRNPYGIDFIVYGNAFRNSDGTSASGASEPAAVMVSKDGNKWYELAGSLYYDPATRRGVDVSYTNPDPNFSTFQEITWKDNEGNAGAIKKSGNYNQPYYPNPRTYGQYHQPLGIGYNASYTGSSMKVTGTMLKGSNSPAFGYGDTHANDEEFSPQAVNPYVKNHYTITNGDGMDLSWAVDSQGKPVQIDEVKYVKVYNPNLHIGGATGEISPEIAYVQKAESSEQMVGVTSDLTALSINNKSIPIEAGKYEYTVDTEQVSSFRVNPTLSQEANIWVNDHWVQSGSDSPYMLAGQTLRIVAQEGEKEPVIYLIHLENIADQSDNADLEDIMILPGDQVATRSGNTFWAEIDSGVSHVIIKATPLSRTSKVYVDGDQVYEKDHWQSNQYLKIEPGITKSLAIEVVAKSGIKVTYLLNVTKKEYKEDDNNQTIDVSFKLVGDAMTWVNTENHTIPLDSTVKYLTDKVLANHGIPFRTDAWGTYIESINGLSEFDKGPNSGWMYKINGSHINVDGYASQKLQQGDRLEWHYTRDYTREEGSENFGNLPFDDQDTSKDTLALDLIGKLDKDRVSQTSLKGAELTNVIERIEQLNNKQDTTLEVNVLVEKEALGFSLSMATEILNKLKDKEKVSLTIGSQIGKIKLDHKTIKEITKNIRGQSKEIEFVFKKTPETEILKEKNIKVYRDHLYDAKILIGDKEFSEFNGGMIELFFPLKLEKDMRADYLSISHIKSNGQSNQLKDIVYDGGDLYGQSGIIASTDSFSVFAISYNEEKQGQKELVFKDLPSSHWAYNDIMFMANKDLIKGTGSSKFEPNRGVTRAEFTQMIANISGQTIVGQESVFIDILPDHWFFTTINWAYEQKIIAGVSNDHFMPGANISRQDAAIIIKRYLDRKAYSRSLIVEEIDFKDKDKIAPYAKESVGFLVGCGLIYGKENHLFDPKAPITRSEATSMVVRVLKALEEK